MKKKIISIFLACFITVSSTVSSFANPLLAIAPEVLGVIATTLVAGGVVINNREELSSVLKPFIEDYKINSVVPTDLFSLGVKLSKDGYLDVSKDFIDYVSSVYTKYFDNPFGVANTAKLLGYYGDIPVVEKANAITDYNSVYRQLDLSYLTEYKWYNITDNLEFKYYKNSADNYVIQARYKFTANGDYLTGDYINIGTSSVWNQVITKYSDRNYIILCHYVPGLYSNFKTITSIGSIYPSFVYSPSPGLDYGLDLEGVKDRTDGASVPIYVPQNLEDLYGKTSEEVLTGTGGYALPVEGTIEFPITGDIAQDVAIGDSITIPKEETVEGEGTGEDTGTGEGTGTGGITFPSFGDSIDFSPFELSGITEKFPFSLPWDLGRLISSFDVTPKAPTFDVPIVSEKITVDLTQFDEWANIVRYFVQISLICTLIYISVRLKG